MGIWLLIGLLVSIGWHVGKLIYKLVEEIIFSRLHAQDWYAVLCKKMPAPERIPRKKRGEDKNEVEAYKGTSMGFLAEPTVMRGSKNGNC